MSLRLNFPGFVFPAPEDELVKECVCCEGDDTRLADKLATLTIGKALSTNLYLNKCDWMSHTARCTEQCTV